jgi:hypothetical protein
MGFDLIFKPTKYLTRIAIKNDETKNEEEDDEDQFEKVVTFTFLYFAIFSLKIT